MIGHSGAGPSGRPAAFEAAGDDRAENDPDFVGGPRVALFDPGPFTDTYVRIVFPRPGVTYPINLDLGRIRAELSRSVWSRTRTYTVRSLPRSPAAQ